MTEKRFYVAKSNLIDGYCVFDREKKYAFSPKPRKADCLNDAHILNELHEENRELQRHVDVMRSGALTDDKRIKKLYDENKQLRQEKQLLYENIDLLKRFIEKQGFKVKLDDKLFRVI